MLEKLSAKELTELILIVLLAYHKREAERFDAIIQECGVKSRLHEFWPKFQVASDNNEMALSHFTQFIMGVLDGGDFSLPDGLTLNSVGILAYQTV